MENSSVHNAKALEVSKDGQLILNDWNPEEEAQQWISSTGIK